MLEVTRRLASRAKFAGGDVGFDVGQGVSVLVAVGGTILEQEPTIAILLLVLSATYI